MHTLRQLTLSLAVLATAALALLASSAHAALITIDFDGIPNPNPFGGPFTFPATVAEDGFNLSPAGGALDVFDSDFGVIDGFSGPNFITPTRASLASATLGIAEADGSAFLFLGLDGYSFGPVDGNGVPLASGHITVRGFALGLLAGEDIFDIASGLVGGALGSPEPAKPFTAANLAGVAIDRLEIMLDGFDTGLNPSPYFFSAADNIALDNDASLSQVPLPSTALLLGVGLAGLAGLRRTR